MIVYQSIDFRTDQSELNRLAIELARHLLPCARLLSSHMEDEAIRLLLEETSKLTLFHLYYNELSEEAFEVILKTVAELESKYRTPPKKIQVYLLAKNFQRNILPRLPFKYSEICLFEWAFIRSEADAAILIREITKDITRDKMLNNVFQSEHLNYSLERRLLGQELDTSELVALARFGMELRGRHHSQM